MATIKAFTDISQAKVLAKVLPLKSADMYFMGHQSIINPKEWEYEDTPKVIRGKYIDFDDKRIFYPCWSLAALLSMLHNNKLCHYDDSYFCQYIGIGDEFPIYSTNEYNNPVDACVAMLNMFPELKESEDERIRKALINGFKDYKGWDEEWFDRITVREAIAWLEKQGKQGKTALEAIKEEKIDYQNCIADKIEPKFHEGEWVVTDKNNAVQIKAIENGKYVLENTMIFSVDYVDKCWRKWDISDAKYCDVLVNGSNIFIFHFLNDTRLMGYCHVNTDNGRFYDDIGKNECFCLIDAVVTPATKEQRDTLEKAMADAGYTFDFEKKELKKIIVPIFHIGDTIAKKHNSDIHDFGSFTITDIIGGKYWYNDRIICDISEQDEWEFYEPVRQKSSWSQDDERIYQSIIDDTVQENQLDDKQISWLKSLKDRATWKPSEEQKPILQMVQWTGNNLKELIDFTGKDKDFDKWFKSQEEYEEYVRKHDYIFKLFNNDGSHYEVPVGAWIVKTPDGNNVASQFRFVSKHVSELRKSVIMDRKILKELRLGDCIIASTYTDEPLYIDRITEYSIHCHTKNKTKSYLVNYEEIDYIERMQPQWKPSEEQMDNK